MLPRLFEGLKGAGPGGPIAWCRRSSCLPEHPSNVARGRGSLLLRESPDQKPGSRPAALQRPPTVFTSPGPPERLQVCKSDPTLFPITFSHLDLMAQIILTLETASGVLYFLLFCLKVKYLGVSPKVEVCSPEKQPNI